MPASSRSRTNSSGQVFSRYPAHRQAGSAYSQLQSGWFRLPPVLMVVIPPYHLPPPCCLSVFRLPLAGFPSTACRPAGLQSTEHHEVQPKAPETTSPCLVPLCDGAPSREPPGNCLNISIIHNKSCSVLLTDRLPAHLPPPAACRRLPANLPPPCLPPTAGKLAASLTITAPVLLRCRQAQQEYLNFLLRLG